MPRYIYGCPTCAREIELDRSIKEHGKLDCRPMCCDHPQPVVMEPVIGKTSFVLKGGGWYKDGYSKR